MKKKILITTTIVVLFVLTFFVGRVSVSNSNVTPAPADDASCSTPPSIPFCIDNLDLEPSGDDEDISPIMVKDIIIFNASVNETCMVSYSFNEGEEEPATVSTKLFKNDYSQVSVEIPNIAPNIYVWDGERFIPAEAEVHTTYKAGENKQREEHKKWVFRTQDGKEYIITN